MTERHLHRQESHDALQPHALEPEPDGLDDVGEDEDEPRERHGDHAPNPGQDAGQDAAGARSGRARAQGS